jgi:hypothetical protein
MLGEKLLWLYWENPPGRTEPPHITLCRQILLSKCRDCTVILVTRENLHHYLPDLTSRVHEVRLVTSPNEPCIAIKCDFIRAFLLERYGGIYIDCDAVVLKDLAEIFARFEVAEFIGMRRTSAPKKHISVGFYGSRPHGRIITSYAAKLRALLEERVEFAWADAGAKLLTPIINANAERVYLFPERRLHPIVAEEQSLFHSLTEPLAPHLAHDPFLFMLFHRMFEGPFKDHSVSELSEGDTLLSKVIRYAGLPHRR